VDFFRQTFTTICKAFLFHRRLRFRENEVELLCRNLKEMSCVCSLYLCISCASSEEFEMEAGSHLAAVGFISEEIATGHGFSLLQHRPSCCICCQIVNDI